jgi:Pyridoxamine 5'-phosphate oxidase
MSLTAGFVRDFIARHKYAVVSTIGPGLIPQSALVGIAVSPDLEVYFDTLETTRKIANLRHNPNVSLVIGWENEQTLQLDGIADEPRGAELGRLKDCYFTAWPDGPERERWKGITYCRVRPQWLRYSSYLEPQRVEEMRLSGAGKAD